MRLTNAQVKYGLSRFGLSRFGLNRFGLNGCVNSRRIHCRGFYGLGLPGRFYDRLHGRHNLLHDRGRQLNRTISNDQSNISNDYHNLNDNSDSLHDIKFSRIIRNVLGPTPPSRLAISISGGVDSMALAFLCSEHFKSYPISLYGYTVDHGARSGSAEEAVKVCENVRSLGIKARVLTMEWPLGINKATFEKVARQKRLDLLLQACQQDDVHHLLLAHTLDDQLETFLMRLCRGSSIIGLAGMRPQQPPPAYPFPPDSSKVSLVRPLLEIRKKQLINTCTQNKIPWFEDSTNQDPAYTVRNAARVVLADFTKLPRALNPENLVHIQQKFIARRQNAESLADDLLQFLISSQRVFIDDQYAIIRFLEFEGFPKRPEDHDTLIFFFRKLLIRIAPYEDLNYRMSELDNVVRMFGSILSQNFKANDSSTIAFTVVKLKFECQLRASSKELQDPVMEWTIRRQTVYKNVSPPSLQWQVNKGKQSSWTNWRLFDRRYWFRINKLVTPSHVKISYPDVEELRQWFIERYAKYNAPLPRWPSKNLLGIQPMVTVTLPESQEKIINLPTLKIYDPEYDASEACEVEYRLKSDPENFPIPKMLQRAR